MRNKVLCTLGILLLAAGCSTFTIWLLSGITDDTTAAEGASIMFAILMTKVVALIGAYFLSSLTGD